MNWFADVQSKLETMQQYCLDHCSVDCLPLEVSYSQNAYNNQFAALFAAIEAYKTANESKEANLRDIILFDFAYTLISDVVFNPSLISHTAPFPTGYNDYWDMFKMGGMVDSILGYADSYYYEGCIILPDATTPKIQADIIALSSSETIDSATRQALISWLQYYPQVNALIQLTENMELASGAIKTKEITGGLIYNDKHAAEIISDFSLDVYIPSYI